MNANTVKVHPHKTRVNSGLEQCVSVTPNRAGGKARYCGTMRLAQARFVIHQSGVTRARAEQVRNVHAWCVGEVVSEDQAQVRPTSDDLADLIQVTYHFQVGRFMTMEDQPRDVTDVKFERALFVGRDFFVDRASLS